MYKYLHQLLEAQHWLRHPGVVSGSVSTICSRARRQIIRKKGQKCVECDAVANLTVDHKLARSLGGTNKAGNLQVLCRPCNQRKAKQEATILKMLQTDEGRQELLHQWKQLQVAGAEKAATKKAQRIAQRELAYQILHENKSPMLE